MRIWHQFPTNSNRKEKSPTATIIITITSRSHSSGLVKTGPELSPTNPAKAGYQTATCIHWQDEPSLKAWKEKKRKGWREQERTENGTKDMTKPKCSISVNVCGKGKLQRFTDIQACRAVERSSLTFTPAPRQQTPGGKFCGHSDRPIVRHKRSGGDILKPSIQCLFATLKST